MERGHYNMPNKDVSQLRHILATCARKYMQVPALAHYTHMCDEAPTQVTTGSAGFVSERRAAEDGAQTMMFLPHVDVGSQ